MAKKMYRRPDGLFEKKLVIAGKRKVFRAHSEREVMQKIAAYREQEESGPTFATVAESWWEQKEPQIRYGTIHGYKAALTRSIDYFGDDPIKQIEAPDINAFLLYMAKRGFSQKTVKNQYTVLRQVFLFALMERHIKTLPTDGVAVPSGLPRSSRHLAPEKAIEAIKQTRPDEFLLPILILYTGARCGEALALQWRDVDLEAGTISISKAVVYHSNQPRISDTKTANAHRAVPLLAPLKRILEQQGRRPAADYIIGGEEPITKSALYKRWEHFCREHGLAHPSEERTAKAGRTMWECEIDRHTLRHEYATILYDARIDSKVAQELLGHADLSTTLKIYTHIRQSRLEKAASTLDAFLEANGTEKAQG
ncbi:tyrosine-type recombinase/integrase [Bittarella massiliensis (ex Durand et al. 2017)]|uniref:tyrosine-type recombinase/integrase n=1 Tax=Bittarella massiliensis (ex Durand et al. 2017) TaxID=1720313 RepID=UPI001AA11C9E|nr:site-specific integrase [Bittarella massiliensis (ex Durand et al. 2017)]MBO1680365.1 site-specific integrase [Bittarella massiliensis (ex Durand et al. 2017)]